MHKTLRIVFILLVAVLLNTQKSNAQIVSASRSEQISIDEGLSQVQVTCMLKDSRGFLWFGTVDGLNRYDGYDIRIFKNDPSNSNSISANSISCLYEDSEKNIWIGTNGGGLNKFNPRTEQFVLCTDKTIKENSERSKITTIVEDEQGKLWLGMRGLNFGIAIFNPQNSSFDYPVFTDSTGGNVSAGSFHAMINDHHGHVWIGSWGSGLLRINIGTREVKNFRIQDSKNQFISLAQDKNGMLWIGSMDRGLLKFDPGAEKFSAIIRNTTLHESIDEIHVIKKKDADNFWIGTSKGLFLLNINSTDVTRTPYMLFYPFIHSLIDDNSILWVGTQAGGVTKIIKAPQNFLHFQKLPNTKSLSSAVMRGIVEDQNGLIWVGTNDAGVNILKRRNAAITSLEVTKHYQYDEKDKGSVSSNLIYPIFQDRNGTVWVGTYGYGLNRFDKSKGDFQRFRHNPNDPQTLSEDRVFAMADDSLGNIFVGTETRALSVFIKSEQRFKYYEARGKKEYHLRNAIIHCIQKDEKNNIWIGAYNGGVYRFSHSVDGVIKYSISDSIFNASRVYSLLVSHDTAWVGTDHGLYLLNLLSQKTTGSADELVVENWIHLHDKNSIPNNVINGILQDAKGNVWISSNRGLSRINRRTLQVKNFTKLDGLQSDEFNINSYAKTSDGYFIFGGVNGLTIFHPDSLHFNDHKPDVVITNLHILNESIRPLQVNHQNISVPEDISFSKELDLRYSDNIINLEFAALDYINPLKNQYAYKLEGFDKDWVYCGTRRSATYTNLNHGEYIFRVKASNNDGVWNEEGTSLKIVILPPPWKTWWAYSAYGIAFLLVLFLARDEIVKRERLKTKAKLKEVEAEKYQELDVLKSRFFANVSHEFRTPLTLLLGPLEKRIAVASDVSDRTELTVMHRNASRLLTLVNQLLDLSRLDAGTLKLKAMEQSLNEFVIPIASQFSSMADSRVIDFKVETEKRVSLFFDPDKLEKVVTNLLSNAFKFTPNGGSISLTIRQFEPTRDFKNGYAEIIISDTGTGIGAEHLPLIFDRFYQVDMSSTRGYEGSGIGLSLTKDLVELHRGKISVTSVVAQGSVFTVQLPLGSSHLKPEEIESSEIEPIIVKANGTDTTYLPEENEEGENINTLPRILIVEDNEDLRYYLRENLKHKFAILEGSDGAQGISMALHEIPDLIISDLMMPKANGLQLCQQLKEDEKTSHIPIVLLTAKADIETKLDGYRQGADDYIPKPFHMEELLVRLENLIANRRRLQQKNVQQLVLSPAAVSVSSMDERFLKKAMEIVEKSINNSAFGVEPFAQEMGVSQTQLYRKLQGITGLSPNEFIRHMRLQRAADLLLQKVGNVADVAYQVGFNNLSYFSKVFKEKFGVTPIEFLKKPSSTK